MGIFVQGAFDVDACADLSEILTMFPLRQREFAMSIWWRPFLPLLLMRRTAHESPGAQQNPQGFKAPRMEGSWRMCVAMCSTNLAGGLTLSGREGQRGQRCCD